MYFNKKTILIASIAFFMLQQAANRVQAEERYYLLVFATQGEPNVPHLAHTFATFVKTNEKDGGAKELAETHTISWLPSNLSVELRKLVPIRGANLSLAESVKLAQSMKTRVTLWGPVQVKKEFYDMAVQQVGRLNRGEISYVALDGRFRGRGASNCFHAVADLDATQSILNTGATYGDSASEMVFQFFRRHIVPTSTPSHWIAEKLNLKPNEIRFATLPTTANVSR